MIEPKFSIGDQIFFIAFISALKPRFKIKRGTIVETNIKIANNKTYITYDVAWKYIGSVRTDQFDSTEVFKTKEELLANLNNTYNADIELNKAKNYG